MKRPILFLASIISALSLTSCLQNETTIHLNKDGSGTLVEETTLGAQMLAMMDQMSALGGIAPGAGGGADKKDPVAEMFSEEKAKARAAKLGEGVTLEKNETIDKKGNKGGRATYHFADINKLKISASDGMKDMSPMGDQAPAGKKSNPIVFTYAAGELTIAMPEPEKPEVPAGGVEAPKGDIPKGDPDRGEPGEQEIAMMKQMMGDMKMSLKVVIEPGIAETNATNREGNTITLMEMEMGKLFENPEVMKNFSKIDKQDPSASLELMKGIPGVKFEVQKKVTVKLN